MDDPKLKAALAELRKLRERLIAEGQDATPEEIDEFIRVKTDNKFDYEAVRGDVEKMGRQIRSPITAPDLALQALQGITLGGFDELVGLFDPDLGKAIREGDAEFRRNRPGVALGTRMVGGVVPALATAPLAAGRTVAQTIARASGLGAAEGAVAGALESEPGSRTSGAVVGGTIGGVAGAALPAAAEGARRLSPNYRAARRMRAALGGEDADAIRNMAMNRMDAVDVDRQPLTRLADLTPGTRLATDFAANASDEARASIVPMLQDRAIGAPERLLEDVRQLYRDRLTATPAPPIANAGPFAPLPPPIPRSRPGATAPFAEARRETLTKSRQAWAASDAGFEGLRKQNPKLDAREVARMLQVPEVAALWKKARLSEDLKNVNVPASVKQFLLPTSPNGRQLRPASFEDLHNFKAKLRELADKAYRSSSKTADGPAFEGLADKIDDILEAQVPAYGAVRKEYAQRMGMEKALTLGEKAWDINDVRLIAQQVKELSPAELTEYRYGMASGLARALANPEKYSATFNTVLNARKSPAVQRKLETIFGDESTFQEFLKRARQEEIFRETTQAGGGSATARRLQNAASEPLDPVDVGVSVASGLPARPVVQGMLSRMGGAQVRRATARNMTRYLEARGINEIDAAIEEILRRTSPSGSRLTSRMLPAMMTRGATSLFGLTPAEQAPETP